MAVGGRANLRKARVARDQGRVSPFDYGMRSALAMRFLVGPDDQTDDSPVATISREELSQLIATIAPNRAVLVPSTGQASGFLMRIHNGAVEGQAVPEWTVESFVDVVLQIAMAADHGDGDALEAGISAVGRMVTDRLISALPPGVDEVLIVAGDLMSLVPLHTAPNDSGGCLLDRVAVSFASNLRFGFMHRPGEPSGDEAAVARARVVLNPSPTSFPYLAYAANEVEYLRRRMTYIDELSGTSATRGALHQMLAQEGDIFHFVGHCFSRPSFDESLLVLSENSSISSNEISWMSLPYRLAFLAGCVSSRGSIDTVGENACVATSFLLAGCRGVVGALLPINDLPAALVANRFYAGWLEAGIPPSEALRRSQLWLRDATWIDVIVEFPWAGASESASRGPRIRGGRNPSRDRPFASVGQWGGFAFYGS